MKTLIALLLLPISALAGNADISWSLPTQNVDGSSLAVTGVDSLASTVIEYAQCASTAFTWPATPGAVTVAVPATARQITGLADGATWCFRAKVVTVGGVFSAYTATASKTLPPLVPNAPGNFTVAVVLGMNMAPVYKLTATLKRSADPAGFIPVGLPCEGNVLFRFREVSFRKVAASDVQFWGVVPSDAIAAPCTSG